MPSERRRLALTLPEDVEAAIFDLADAFEKPASKVVTELLQEMVPQLQGVAKMARALKAGKHAAAKTALRHMVGDTMANMLAQTQPDMFQAKKGRK